MRTCRRYSAGTPSLFACHLELVTRPGRDSSAMESAAGQLRNQRMNRAERRVPVQAVLAHPALRSEHRADLSELRLDLSELSRDLSELRRNLPVLRRDLPDLRIERIGLRSDLRVGRQRM